MPEENNWVSSRKTSSLLVALMLMSVFPLGLYLMWKYTDWSRALKIVITGVFGLFLLGAVAGAFNNSSKPEVAGDKIEVQAETVQTTPTPETAVTPTPEPTLTPTPDMVEDKLSQEADDVSSAEVVLGNSSKAEGFYRQIDKLHKQGKVTGELFKENTSDPVVDINLKVKAVQLGLKYAALGETIDENIKRVISGDFTVIKTLAEADRELIDPQFGTVSVLVLTVHDNNGVARGELGLYSFVSEVPDWDIW